MFDLWMKLCNELKNQIDELKLYEYLLAYVKDNKLYTNNINNDGGADMNWLYDNYNLVLSEHYSDFKEYVLEIIK